MLSFTVSDMENSMGGLRLGDGLVDVGYKQRVFGQCFKDIDRCLGIMKEYGVIASGSAVLQGLLPQATWVAGDLDLYIGNVEDWSDLKCVLPWIVFLRSEGYKMECVPGRARWERYPGAEVWLFDFRMVF